MKVLSEKRLSDYMAEQIAAFGAASNMLSGLDGVYMSIWMALPLSEWLYKRI